MLVAVEELMGMLGQVVGMPGLGVVGVDKTYQVEGSLVVVLGRQVGRTL